MAHEAALQISAMGAQWLTREDVPADVVESERRVATEKSLAEGKPEKIVPKIVEGRLNAFYKENVLLEQSYVKDPSKTVGDLFKEVGGAAWLSLVSRSARARLSEFGFNGESVR